MFNFEATELPLHLDTVASPVNFGSVSFPSERRLYADVVLNVTPDTLKQEGSGVDRTMLGPVFEAGLGLSMGQALGLLPGQVLFFLKSRRLVELSVINALFQDTFPYTFRREQSIPFYVRNRDFLTIPRSECFSGVVKRDEYGNRVQHPFYVDGSYYEGLSSRFGAYVVKKSWLDKRGIRNFEYGRKITPEDGMTSQNEFCIVPLVKVERVNNDPMFADEGQLIDNFEEEGEIELSQWNLNYRWTQLKPWYVFDEFLKECIPISPHNAFDEDENYEIRRAIGEPDFIPSEDEI